ISIQLSYTPKFLIPIIPRRIYAIVYYPRSCLEKLRLKTVKVETAIAFATRKWELGTRNDE
ncbi:MAG: hypothetical protein ACO31I_19390, partial [Prochlorotrichaceae cyanobacterium]